MIRSLRAAAAVYPRPHSSMVPGLKFVITTSASSTRRRKTSRPLGTRRSIVMLRFPRLYAAKKAARRSLREMGSHRLWSPNPGSSILTTSAPHSCIVNDAWGPWTRSPASRTRMPSRGPMLNVVLELWREWSSVHLCDWQPGRSSGAPNQTAVEKSGGIDWAAPSGLRQCQPTRRRTCERQRAVRPLSYVQSASGIQSHPIAWPWQAGHRSMQQPGW